jgi:hypothetical protein
MKKNIFIILLFFSFQSIAQTDIDGLFMDKHLFCAGGSYGISSWKKYWEGSLKRDNLNLGSVSGSNTILMGNYGVRNKLNIIYGLPFVKTKASAGQLKGQKGIQDLSVFVKWTGYEKQAGQSDFKAILITGFSIPMTNYTPDLLPLSIGLHSKTATIRVMADYQHAHLFGTVSGSYILRKKVRLDRNTYYTTSMHYSNEVEMPDACNYNIRVGYRSDTWIIELIANKWITRYGFDITRNNMPFVSNKMDATTFGLHIKYETGFINGLSLVADGATTIKGRNAGDANSFSAGVFYIMDFNSSKKMK